MAIWGKSIQTGKVEKVDSGDSVYLLTEYRLAFGQGWILWRWRKADDPTKEGENK